MKGIPSSVDLCALLARIRMLKLPTGRMAFNQTTNLVDEATSSRSSPNWFRPCSIALFGSPIF
jgi:hypothetical protein